MLDAVESLKAGREANLNAMSVRMSGRLSGISNRMIDRIIARQNVPLEMRQEIRDAWVSHTEQVVGYGKNEITRGGAITLAEGNINPKVLTDIVESRSFNATETTLSRLDGDIFPALQTALNEGQAFGVTAAEMATEFHDMADWEMMRITKTETHSTYNQTKYEGMKSANMLGCKEWVVSGLDNMRDWHEEMDGQVVQFDQPFISGLGNELMYPGDPDGEAEEIINCACTFNPVACPPELDPLSTEEPQPTEPQDLSVEEQLAQQFGMQFQGMVDTSEGISGATTQEFAYYRDEINDTQIFMPKNMNGMNVSHEEFLKGYSSREVNLKKSTDVIYLSNMGSRVGAVEDGEVLGQYNPLQSRVIVFGKVVRPEPTFSETGWPTSARDPTAQTTTTTLDHELGHGFDYSHGMFSESSTWKEAMAADNPEGRRQMMSSTYADNYFLQAARNQYIEDFAESNHAMNLQKGQHILVKPDGYISKVTWISKNPNRARVITNLYKERNPF